MLFKVILKVPLLHKALFNLRKNFTLSLELQKDDNENSLDYAFILEQISNFLNKKLDAMQYF